MELSSIAQCNLKSHAAECDIKLNTKSLGYRLKIEVVDKQHDEEKTNLFISQT